MATVSSVTEEKRTSYSLFFLMFAIVCLINANYSILKSARNALTVADLGGSAGLIPYFELFGTLPAAILVTWGMSRLMNRCSLQKVFAIASSAFLGFLLIFAFGLYPFVGEWAATVKEMSWLPGHEIMARGITLGASLSFFVAGELWKVVLLSVLFWALLNQHLSLKEAKSYYGPLMLGISVGSIVAGPLISLCTAESLGKIFPTTLTPWARSLDLLALLISVLGGLTIYLFFKLNTLLSSRAPEIAQTDAPKEKLSLLSSLRTFWKSPFLSALGWIVCADYIAYALGEVIFLDLVKERFPDPRIYCDYMGKLSMWTGVLTCVSSLIITPWMIQRYRWVAASMVTPISLLVIEGAFFLGLCGKEQFQTWLGYNHVEWLEMIVFGGSLLYCVCRAAKLTLFDTTKELAFIHLPRSEKIQGKLMIDGIGSRFGRGGASLLSIVLIQSSGGVLASAGLAGILATVVISSSVFATWRLGSLVEKQGALSGEQKKV